MIEQTDIEKIEGKDLVNFGRRDDVRELSERIRAMLPGGEKYTSPEAQTLAQIAIAHNLDPFNGEVWLIKKNERVLGALIGIKGHRKHAKLQANYWGFGCDGGFTRVIDPKKIEDYGASPGDLVYEYRIMDDVTLGAYTDNLERLVTLGIPLAEAQKMVGPVPVTFGVGIWVKGEASKMKPVQVSMFRAEKDALKRRFDVKFTLPAEDGVPILSADLDDELNGDELEAEYNEVEPRDTDEIIAELGYGPNGEEEEAKPSTREEFTREEYAILKAVVQCGYSENAYAARAALKHCAIENYTENEALKFMKLYRGWRDIGGDVKQAAKAANDGKVPK